MTYYNQIIEGTENNAIAELKSIKVSIALLQKKARMHRKIVSQLSKGTDDQDSKLHIMQLERRITYWK